jgi:hypothetical protein
MNREVPDYSSKGVMLLEQWGEAGKEVAAGATLIVRKDHNQGRSARAPEAVSGPRELVRVSHEGIRLSRKASICRHRPANIDGGPGYCKHDKCTGGEPCYEFL